MLISRALFGISFRVPSKEAFAPGPPHRTPTDRDAPFLEHFFIHLSKSSAYKPTSMFSNGCPYVEIRPFPQPSFTCLSNSSIKVRLINKGFHPSFEGPRKGASPHIPQKGVPSKRALAPVSPHRAHTDRAAPFPEPHFIHLSNSPGIRAPPRFPR